MSTTSVSTNEITSNANDSKTIPMVIYVLYLVGFFTGITALVGVILAYVYKGSAPQWLGSHYQYQIRTFMIGLLQLFIGFITTFLLIGWLVLLFWAVWTIARCIIGLKALSENVEIKNPTTWLFK